MDTQPKKILEATKTLKSLDSGIKTAMKLKSDEECTVYGRISRIYKRKQFLFLKLRSGDFVEDLQVVIPKSLLPKASLYSTLRIAGKMVKTPDGKSLEMLARKVLYYGECPSSKVKINHKMSDDLLRAHVSQRLWTKRYQDIMIVRDRISHQLQVISRELGMTRIFAPFITFSDCEGAGETFEVKSSIEGFFKKKAFLTVSGQVDEETATNRMICPTYIFGPSFRSDPSKTRFHACEFWHYEPEIPFISLSDLMDLEEVIISRLLKYVLETPDLLSRIQSLHKGFKKVEVDLEEMKQFSGQSFTRISYTEAIKILISVQKKEPIFEVEPKWGMDLGKEHERYLCEKHFERPTFVHGYPSQIKSFYMLQSDPFKDKDVTSDMMEEGFLFKTELGLPVLQTCQGVDLLIPGIGELCGGSIREHRSKFLLESMKKKGLDPEDYKEYLDLREEGSCPTGGFGLGFDRFLMMVTGAHHIKDVTLFPRGCQK